jgi:diketogulonate reductase-like aldo/keto reductase
MGKSKAILNNPEQGPAYYFNKYEGADWDPALRLETWRAMEDALAEGKCRAIGVANFTVKHLKHLMAESKIVPAVNQVEFHPYLFQSELLAFCREHGIVLQAYGSLGGQDTKSNLLAEPAVLEAAEATGATPAQVLLRWALQHGVPVIPKSTKESRLRENMGAIAKEGLVLSEEQMAALDSLRTDKRLCWKSDPLKALDFD